MKKRTVRLKVKEPCDDLRIDPEKRLCEMFDSVSIKKFDAPEPGVMGFRVMDNCAEEHMM